MELFVKAGSQTEIVHWKDMLKVPECEQAFNDFCCSSQIKVFLHF